jgi:TM2 domain-containing membrane protein YozV
VIPAGAPKPPLSAPPPLPAAEASAPPGAAPAIAGSSASTSASATVPPPPPLEPPATNANPNNANPNNANPNSANTNSAATTAQPPALDVSRFGAPPQMPGGPTEARPEDSMRVLAGVLAILFGYAGVHKFVLGYREAGAVMLLVTFVGSLCTSGISLLAAWVVGVIEGIVYLSKSDAEFVREYQVGRREWF